MKFSCQIARPEACSDLRDDFIEFVLRQTLSISGAKFEAAVVVSVALVSEEEIKTLNKTYRGRDESTDILSFPDAFAEREGPAKGVFREDVFLGELVLSCAKIKKYATMDGVGTKRAFAFVLSHGLLHLLGWRHSPEMFALQDKVTDKADGFPRNR